MDVLAEALLPDHSRALVPYPGLESRPGSFLFSACEDAIQSTAESLPAGPRIGLGYSFGANLLLRQVALGNVAVDALILLSPVASWARRAEEAHKQFRPQWAVFGKKYGFEPNAVLKEMRELPASEEAIALAPRVPCPTLVLHGLRDVDVPVQHGMDLAEAIPDARFASVPTDHFWRGAQRQAAGQVGFFLGGLGF